MILSSSGRSFFLGMSRISVDGSLTLICLMAGLEASAMLVVFIEEDNFASATAH